MNKSLILQLSLALYWSIGTRLNLTGSYLYEEKFEDTFVSDIAKQAGRLAKNTDYYRHNLGVELDYISKKDFGISAPLIFSVNASKSLTGKNVVKDKQLGFTLGFLL